MMIIIIKHNKEIDRVDTIDKLTFYIKQFYPSVILMDKILKYFNMQSLINKVLSLDKYRTTRVHRFIVQNCSRIRSLSDNSKNKENSLFYYYCGY